MEQPNRQYSQNQNYRYGFNGKENDREWGTAGLTQDYGFRLYNPAIAKFLSVDPLAKDYAGHTPYAFAMNRVIDGIDMDGLEYVKFTEMWDIITKKSKTPTEQKVAWTLLAMMSKKPTGKRIVEYNGETYINMGRHIYVDKNGYLTTKKDGNKKVSTWIYNNIQLVNEDNYVAYGEYGDCYKASFAQCVKVGNTPIRGLWAGIRLYDAKQDKDYGVNALNDAIDLIHTELEAGRAVQIGLDMSPDNTVNADGTDHFVTISGRYRGDDGREYFNFAENAVSDSKEGTNKKLNRLWIENGKLVGESVFKEEYKINRVTLVQPNQKEK